MIKFNHRKIYSPPDEIYLERWSLSLLGFSVKLHHIHKSDEDRGTHDHPWKFLSVILWGGYDERLWRRGKESTVSSRPGKILFRDLKDRHKIERILRPCWTLVICGKKRTNWGFWVDGNFVHHSIYRSTGVETML